MLEFMADIARIELGTSVLEGEWILQLATAAGLRVELLRNEHPETGGAFALGSCSLLVTEADEVELRDLLADFSY